MLNRKKFSDIKSLINLALVRLNTVRKKALDELNHRKRLLAKNLQDSEYPQARLEAERIVKIDWKIEALNLLEIKAEEVRDNHLLLQNSKEVPYDLDEAIATVIYCCDRANIPELADVLKVLTRKYGKEYIELNADNSAKRVDEKLVHRLSGQRPNAFLVYSYMKEIAANFGVTWVEDEATKALGERFDVPMTAGTQGLTSASGLGANAYAVTDGRILPKGQKPKGYVIPEKMEEVVKPVIQKEEIETAEVISETPNDDIEEENSEEVSQEQKFDPVPPTNPKTVQNIQKPSQKPVQKTAQNKPKTVQKKTLQKKTVEKKPVEKKDDGFSDLEARFNKLRDL